MKVQVVIYDQEAARAFKECASAEQVGKWFKDDESITVEFDLDAGTARVCEVGE